MDSGDVWIVTAGTVLPSIDIGDTITIKPSEGFDVQRWLYDADMKRRELLLIELAAIEDRWGLQRTKEVRKR